MQEPEFYIITYRWEMVRASELPRIEVAARSYADSKWDVRSDPGSNASYIHLAMSLSEDQAKLLLQQLIQKMSNKAVLERMFDIPQWLEQNT